MLSLHWLESIALALHYLWVIGMPLYQINGIYYNNIIIGKTLAIVSYIFLAECIGGILTGACFVLNHNGMPVYTQEEALEKSDFFRNQILTGRNVKASHFVNWFTGGLNFQIEHHIWPTMPRHNLHIVAPVVKAICKKHGVAYHETGFISGLVEVVERLVRVTQSATKQGIIKSSN